MSMRPAVGIILYMILQERHRDLQLERCLCEQRLEVCLFCSFGAESASQLINSGILMTPGG